MDFYFAIAGMSFHVVGYRFPVPAKMAPYRCEPSADAIKVVLTDETLAFEKAQGAADGADLSDESYEFFALMRQVAKAVLAHGRMFMHGASIAYRGRGFLFTAHSGTGKTTHIRLWMKYLGDDVQVVNGDRPILTFGERITISGTPWAGKEGYQQNITVPLEAMVLLKRGSVNAMRRVTVEEAMDFLYGQVFLMTESDCALSILACLDQMLSGIPVYELKCTMEEDALRCSFEALTGEKYRRSVRS